MTENSSILIVDDNPDILRILTELLEREGFEARPALSGEIALQAAEMSPPDLILLDIRMPGIDGYETCRRLKGNVVTSRIPVIFISAGHDLEERVVAFQAGGVDYIVKPFQEEELLARVRTQIRLCRVEDLVAEVAARRETEAALRRDRQRLDFYVNNSPMATIEWDAGFAVTRWAGEAENIFGWSREETVGKPVMDLQMIYEEDLPIVQNTMRQLSGGVKYVVATNRNYRRDRRVITCEWYNTVLSDSEGRMESVLSQVMDISERIKAEEALRESESRFRGAFEHSAIGMALVSPEGKWLRVNSSLCEMIGYSEEELLAKTFQEITHPDDLEADLEYVRQMLAGAIETYTMEKRYFHKQGHTVWILLAVSLVRESSGAPLHFISQIENITGRKQAEEDRLTLERQMLNAQKLESLGILAGGVAHDFNNILTAVIGNAELAIMRLPPASPVLSNLQQIEKSAERAADLAKQMLAYSGKGRFVIETIDLNSLLEEMLHIMEVSVSKNVLLRLDLHRPLPPMVADAAQIRQIIMNLVINGSEAIADKSGVITIKTGSVQVEEMQVAGICQGEKLCGGEYVFFEVSDSGCGMDKETVAKIYDPFFSTKFTGRGLGMSAVQGIVRGHKGAILIASEPGSGSCFRILLPAAAAHPDVSAKKISGENWKGEGKVLLVDDEEGVLNVGTALLKELGFTTVTAVNGRDGIDVYRQNPDIAFVILDLTMPVMGGEQCFSALKQISPDVKVIISSGYREQEVLELFAGSGVSGFIQKPYKLSALKEAIMGIKG